MTENKSLITMPEKVPTFKSKALNTATNEIYKVAENVYTTAFEGNKQICIILARIEKTKAYKDDGFKSLAEYCGAIGFDKSKVHKMENAGRLYDSENEAVKEFAASMGYGNLAVIASAPVDSIAEAVESGELSADSSQDDLRAWKTKHNAEHAVDKVLPKFEVWGVHGNGDTFHYDAIEIENVQELSERHVKVGSFEIGAPGDSQKWTVYANIETGTMLRLRAEKVKKAPKAKVVTKAVKDMTKEELIALAESMGMKVTF